MNARRWAGGVAAVVTAGAITVSAGQNVELRPQTPTFKTAIDLVPVDVNVVDNTGRPVIGLNAADFTLSVDGRPRRIASAEYISATQELTAAAATPTDYSTNAVTGGGRLILLVVDQGNIGLGRGRLAMSAAGKFVDRLTPSDRIGLVVLPGAGPQIDFTTNHALVTAALSKLVGQASNVPTQYRVGVAEAYKIQRGDQLTLSEVITRECTSLRSPQELEVCREMVGSEAQNVYAASRDRSRQSLGGLRTVIEHVTAMSTPKTIVFISEGLVIEREQDLVTWLGPMATRGQVTMHVLQLDEPYSDASEARPSPTRQEDLSLAEDGLSMMAGLARGSLMRVVASPENVFNRLALEMSAYYLLSFEPEAGDRDGKSHKIKVTVPQRNGVELRARSEFAVSTSTGARSAETILADALRSPLLANDIPLRLSTYTLRDPKSDKLRILLVADIDRAQNPDGRITFGYTLTDEKGKMIDSQIDREVKVAVDPITKRQTYTGFVFSNTPGAHTLKIAVVDESGRRGSVERTFRAALTPFGQVRATDLLVAERLQEGADGVVPVVGRELTSGTMHGYLELYSDVTDALSNVGVVFEIAQSEQGRALDGASGKMLPPAADLPNRRVVEGSVPLALLPPGDYIARAIVSVDGRKVGQLTRPLRVGRTVSAATRPNASPLGLRSLTTKTTPIPFTSRIERFERGSVLAPQVVGFFLERMNFGERGGANAAPAIDHARAGRFDEAVQALGGGSANATVPATFLSGLALYSKGELEAAANKFREALRIDSEFFPAAFYLGSCYAAGGRDSEAVGAWQMSLVTESDAPFIFTLLGDALIRLREVDHALEILNEASGVWPDNEEVQVRLAAALALSGKRADALQKLEPYLAAHPDDVERHFLALRTLYEAKADGKPVRSQAEDRALFAKWAAAYVAAKGPQQALIEQWQRALSK
jgi:VWFA-related protein